MKQVHFERVWRCPLSATSYEEYPAGSDVVVSDDRAAKAKADGVLKGEPTDVPAEKPDKLTGPKA